MRSFLIKFSWSLFIGAWWMFVMFAGMTLFVLGIVTVLAFLGWGGLLAEYLIDNHGFPNWSMLGIGFGGMLVGGSTLIAIGKVLEPITKNLYLMELILWYERHQPSCMKTG